MRYLMEANPVPYDGQNWQLYIFYWHFAIQRVNNKLSQDFKIRRTVQSYDAYASIIKLTAKKKVTILVGTKRRNYECTVLRNCVMAESRECLEVY